MPVYAAELAPIIYSSKQESNQTMITSSTEILEEDKLGSTNDARLNDELIRNSSVEVNQTGITGGQASVFIRGLEGRHTVFAIDGVRVFDSASIQKILNPALINSSQIERIEILKGSQSVLYGSDAIGGVINIITKKSGLKNSVSLETGIFNSFELGQSLILGESILDIDVFYQEDLTHNDLVVGNELDKKINRGGSLRYDTQIGTFETSSTIKIINDFSETDGQDFSSDLPFDSKGYYSDVTNTFFMQQFKKENGSDQILQVDFSYHQSVRENVSPSSNLTFKGNTFQTEVKKVLGGTLLGAQFLEETYSDEEVSNHKLSNFDVFSNIQKEFGAYGIELGARGTSNRYYGEHLVYNAGISKKISDNQRVVLSQKTGFKAPSSYQLFGETSFGKVGNEDLIPEKSVSLDLSHIYRRNGFSTDFSLFRNEVEDFIGFRNNSYANIEGAIYSGVEASVSQQFDKFKVGVQGSVLDYDTSDGEIPERRAKERFKFNFNYQISDQLKAAIDYRYKGARREDINGRSEILSAYDVLDISFQYTQKKYDANLSFKNVFDEIYEEAFLYATQRFGVQMKVTYRY